MSRFVPVADPADPRLAAYRDVRERDLTRAGELVAEGRVVLDHLLGASAAFAPVSLLVLKARLAGLEAVLERLPMNCPVYVADAPVIDAVAGFAVHRGVLLHARRRAEAPGFATLAARLGREGGTAVIGVGLSNHDNVGALFRNAGAFGARFVALDESSCDPFYRKAIRVSVGAVFSVPFARVASAAEAAAALAAAGVRCLALSPRGATPLANLEPRGPAALFLGAEGPGLPEPVIAGMESVAIEMAPGLDSLNVSTAAAIVLHRFYAGGTNA
jgi:tRNA G18 (ribose-2'-O)-methylase SpoU